MVCCSVLCDSLIYGSYWCPLLLFFFFKQRTAYEMRISDWSSDVCSSDLLAEAWFARIREDDLGFRSDGNDFVQLAGAGTGTKFEKSRTFGKNAEKILADFYFQHLADILPAYFTRAARLAEWFRRTGSTLETRRDRMAELDDTSATASHS